MGKGKLARNRIFILNDPDAPRLNADLAVEIGLFESILLLQIEFWIAISENFRDGHWWTCQSTSHIQQAFPFMSLSSIKRAIASLVDKKLLVVANYNSLSFDRTRWFRIDFEGASKLKSVTVAPSAVVQNSQRQAQDGPRQAHSGPRGAQDGPTIPETSQRILTEREKAPLSVGPQTPEPEGVTTRAASPKGVSIENKSKANPKPNSSNRASGGDLSGNTTQKDHEIWETWRQGSSAVPSTDLRLGPAWMYLTLCPAGKRKKLINYPAFYELLDTITAANILDPARWKEVINVFINTGQNYLNVEYLCDCYHHPGKLDKLRPTDTVDRTSHAAIGL